MISRMREAYDETGSTEKAIELGLARTGKLVTSGALVLMFAFLVLSTGPGYEFKPLAIGLAAGIILDATAHPRPARAGADAPARRRQLVDAADGPGPRYASAASLLANSRSTSGDPATPERRPKTRGWTRRRHDRACRASATSNSTTKSCHSPPTASASPSSPPNQLQLRRRPPPSRKLECNHPGRSRFRSGLHRPSPFDASNGVLEVHAVRELPPYRSVDLQHSAQPCGFQRAERRRSRTYQPLGYNGLPILKTARVWLWESDYGL